MRFVVQLRKLKDVSGRTLRELAQETGYSSSSWERYLGGRSLPPRGAVEALAQIAGGDPARVLALLEMAADAWKSRQVDAVDAVSAGPQPDAAGEADASGEPADPAGSDDSAEHGGDGRDGRAHEANGPGEGAAGRPAEPPVPAPADGDPRPRRRPGAGWRRLVTLGGGAALGAVITLLVVDTSQGAAPCSPVPAVHKPVTYGCHYSQRATLWYAGNSTTSTRHIVVDMFGPDVAELQCLLQRAGITPGGIDGNFGPLTEHAVIQAQKQFHLDVDGQVGPHTWAALRR
ncbi:peptidoglycan-binding protein [Actinacidiphila rubida]|uniref:peptidoglycan-binding protein n=1 Tax=Actinacidiphila rubida TaxID=310780 RepID=UPI00210B9A82|nr:peptidoglycan-binding protein [Actinacidiphila rubida]